MTTRASVAGRDSLRVLLDNQQWNYLAAPEEYATHDGLDLSDLQEAAKCREIEVIGSLDILQEIIEASHSKEAKYRRMVELFIEFMGNRLLLPLPERHPREVHAGGLLPLTERYLRRDDRRKIERLARNLRDVLDMSEEVYGEKQVFEAQEVQLREEMRAKLEHAIGGFKLPGAKDWFDSTDLADWVHSVVTSGVERGRNDPEPVETVSYDRYPSAFTFVAARLAQIVYVNAEGRKIQSSDLADAYHLASGPYVHAIVSDDKVLHDRFALFADRVPFDLMTSIEFSDKTGVGHRSDSAV